MQQRITVTDQEEILLKELSEFWKRPVADIAVDAFRRGFPQIVGDYLQVRRIDRPLTAENPLEYRSLHQAICRNWDKLITGCRIPSDRLILIRDGDKPTDLELARLAIALNTTEEYLESLPRTNGDKEKHDATTKAS